MAHDLNFNNGKYSFASTQKAWHDLGQIVDKAMTAEQAIQLAGLDYEVAKVPNYALINGEFKITPNSHSIHRTDNGVILGDKLGKGYTIVQNKEAFSFFDSIVGTGQAIYETAGALGEGERIFITAKMPETIHIAGTDDLTEVYVLLTSAHDGSGAIVGAITPVRVVCANTLAAGLRQTISKVSIRHSSSVHSRLEDAHKVLGITRKLTQELNEVFNHLANKTVSDGAAKELIEQLFRSEKNDSTRITNIREAVWHSYNVGIGQEKIIGTAWGLYNGITHYLSHDKGYRSDDNKFESLLFGQSNKVSEEALDLLVAL
jgi:phage/plasmid-like protein (TIGR03299 family)